MCLTCNKNNKTIKLNKKTDIDIHINEYPDH